MCGVTACRSFFTPCALILLAFLAAPGCQREQDVPPDDSSEANATPAPAAPVLSPPVGEPASLTGTWYVLAPELPYRGLLVTLQETSSPDAWEGSWLSFDWRGSRDGLLHRSSLRVAVSAHRVGNDLVITGHAPQINQSGLPNGDEGLWELTVQRKSLAGEELSFTGRLVNPADTPPEGVAVDVVPRFRPWTP